jgi:hypothetical protein
MTTRILVMILTRASNDIINPSMFPKLAGASHRQPVPRDRAGGRRLHARDASKM